MSETEKTEWQKLKRNNNKKNILICRVSVCKSVYEFICIYGARWLQVRYKLQQTVESKELIRTLIAF